MSSLEKLIIIGSGPAGYTAAVYAARAGLSPLLIEGKQPGGQLMGTTHVENWPGIKQILGPVLMNNMKEHAASFGTRFSAREIVRVDFSQRPLTLWTDRQEQLQAQAIIIATGATPKRLGCPGEEAYWGKGVTTCAVCDGAFYRNKPVVIIGGGDTALEDASFMTNFTENITIVHILDKLTASKAMQDRVLNNPKITILYNSTVSAFEGDGQHLTHTIITNKITGENKKTETSAAFVAIGLTPNTHVFKNQLDLDPRGYALPVNHTATNIPGVFVAGDVADFHYRQAITSAATGCMAALDAERFLKQG